MRESMRNILFAGLMLFAVIGFDTLVRAGKIGTENREIAPDCDNRYSHNKI